MIARENYCSAWGSSTKTFYVSLLFAFNAVFFVYCDVLVSWKEMKRIISENGIFDGVSAAEWIAYGVLITASIVLVAGISDQKG